MGSTGNTLQLLMEILGNSESAQQAIVATRNLVSGAAQQTVDANDAIAASAANAGNALAAAPEKAIPPIEALRAQYAGVQADIERLQALPFLSGEEAAGLEADQQVLADIQAEVIGLGGAMQDVNDANLAWHGMNVGTMGDLRTLRRDMYALGTPLMLAYLIPQAGRMGRAIADWATNVGGFSDAAQSAFKQAAKAYDAFFEHVHGADYTRAKLKDVQKEILGVQQQIETLQAALKASTSARATAEDWFSAESSGLGLLGTAAVADTHQLALLKSKLIDLQAQQDLLSTKLASQVVPSWHLHTRAVHHANHAMRDAVRREAEYAASLNKLHPKFVAETAAEAERDAALTWANWGRAYRGHAKIQIDRNGIEVARQMREKSPFVAETPAEAQRAANQFWQAMGRAQHQHLESVVENQPRALKALDAAFGGTRQGLAGFSEEMQLAHPQVVALTNDFASFGAGMSSAVAQAIIYGNAIGPALQKAAKAELASLAVRALANGIYETAVGFADLIWNPPAAAAAFTAAEIFFSVAAMAGAGAAAIPNAKGGGRGAGAGRGSEVGHRMGHGGGSAAEGYGNEEFAPGLAPGASAGGPAIVLNFHGPVYGGKAGAEEIAGHISEAVQSGRASLVATSSMHGSPVGH